MKVKNPSLLWRRFIKYPIQKYNGYIPEAKGIYKIVELKLGRHFSYINICKVDKSGISSKPIYITGVGTDWEDTVLRLVTNMSGYMNNGNSYWVDWSHYTS